MKLFKTHKVAVPAGQDHLVAADTWEVRWHSRNGDSSFQSKAEVAIFFSEEDANKFAAGLRAAFQLLRYSKPATSYGPDITLVEVAHTSYED